MTESTVLYVIKGGKILLIKKKRGIGKGMWNGPGGKVADEDIEVAAVREVKEEIGIVPDNVKKAGELEFYLGGDRMDWHVHVFTAADYDGIEKESKEAEPKWFSLSRIPYNEMWPDDAIWMPLMLNGKKFRGKFYYESKRAKKLLRHEIEVL